MFVKLHVQKSIKTQFINLGKIRIARGEPTLPLLFTRNSHILCLCFLISKDFSFKVSNLFFHLLTVPVPYLLEVIVLFSNNLLQNCFKFHQHNDSLYYKGISKLCLSIYPRTCSLLLWKVSPCKEACNPIHLSNIWG